MSDNSTLEMALTAYGLPHCMGYLKTAGGEIHPSPLGILGLMDLAQESGLAAIEAPIPPADQMPLSQLRDELQERGLRMAPDYMAVLDADADHFRGWLRQAAFLGAPVIRAVISRVLCGDRRKLDGRWDAHLSAVSARLVEVLPLAEDLGICIAVENHQDATSDDLLWLAEQTGFSDYFGVTLDTGNPLAVCEGAVEYARRIAPLIRHIHLKDYTIHHSPEGYRLVRCAAGDGVVNFQRILELVRANGHAVLPGIEIGAQATRTIPFLESDWWHHYPQGHSAFLPDALRVLWEHGRPVGEPYSSAWERGEGSESVGKEEMMVVRKSVDYFKRLG